MNKNLYGENEGQGELRLAQTVLKEVKKVLRVGRDEDILPTIMKLKSSVISLQEELQIIYDYDHFL